jgi:uncharacterized protein YdeI (YjbR/CyaY-like superfamily)
LVWATPFESNSDDLSSKKARIFLSNAMNPAVNELLSKTKKWRQELEKLRAIVLDCGLVEEIKWKVPCYTFQQKNVVLIHGFKEYCALNFFKGALLSDAEGLLVQQTENVQAGRQLRFTTLAEITEKEALLKAYIFEAIELEKAKINVVLKKPSEQAIPEELQLHLTKNELFKTAFYGLTPGRQRGYILHFSAPKQSTTRTSRIEKCIPRILAGKGLTDCTCGLSKRMPTCDGSHTFLQKQQPFI